MKAAVCSLILTGAAHAATVVHTQTFTVDRSFSADGSSSFSTTTLFAMTVNPFDASLGTLESVTVSWDMNGSIAGVSSDEAGATVSVNMGGVIQVAGQAVATATAAGSASSSPGESFSGVVAMTGGTGTTTLPIPNPWTYNPAISNAFTGSTPFSFVWGGNYVMNYDNIESLIYDVDVVGTITYNYASAVVPEPAVIGMSGLGLLGLLRRRR